MNDTLADRLLLSRRHLMNQDELAKKADIRRGYISQLERGVATNPTIDVVEKLAKALGVRPEYLVCWSDDPLGESNGPSISEGRVVYQVNSPTEYRLVQEMLDLFGDLSADNQRLLLQLAEKLRKANNARVVE